MFTILELECKKIFLFYYCFFCSSGKFVFDINVERHFFLLFPILTRIVDRAMNKRYAFCQTTIFAIESL